MIFDGGRWDRIRSWGYWWKWNRGRAALRIDLALYALPLPSVVMRTTAGDELGRPSYGLSCTLWLGTRGLTDPPAAVAVDVPCPEWLWRPLDWLLPSPLEGKRWCRAWSEDG